MPWPSKIRAELKSYIERTRENNDLCEKLGLRFSTACGCCKDEKPARRFVSTSCGHVLCADCANGDSCPSCHISSTYTRIFEQSGSRRCEICTISEPGSRAVLRDCGHVACTACLAQLRLVTNDLKAPLFCPFCRTKMSDEPIQIKEKRIKIKYEQVAKRKMTPEPIQMRNDEKMNAHEEPIAKRTRESKNQVTTGPQTEDNQM